MRTRHVVIGLALFLEACVSPRTSAPQPQPLGVSSASMAAESSSSSPRAAGSSADAGLLFPIADAPSRVTKKPFGIHVSPSSSPVQPERFTGYHTGEDFETFPSEKDSDVPVTAVCTGTVRFAGWVNGYGGVLIEQCTYHNQPVTVLYGHLNIDSVSLKSGSALDAGARIGLLGKGFSTQTDGERKHLHLAIHKGTALNYRGYVVTAQELDAWINPFPM